MKSYRPSTQATRANPSAFSWLGSMYSGQVSPMTSDCPSCNKHEPAQPVVMQPDLPSRSWEKKSGTDIFDINGSKYLMIVYYYRNYVIDELKC